LEGQTLHYYLKIFSFLLIILILFLIYIYYIFYITIVNLAKDEVIIDKSNNLNNIVLDNFQNYSSFEIFFYKNFLKFYDSYIDHIHYGEFYIGTDKNFISFIQIITKPSNIIKKISIIEGWSKYELNDKLKKIFPEYTVFDYVEILADTYFIEDADNFNKFNKKLLNFKKNFFLKYKTHPLLSKYSIDEIMIIGSLLEKEGLDYEDKKLISSVIFNRLELNMRLQIDATVVYSITEGKYKIDRKLNYNDLKLNNPFNTYKIDGLPPSPISYVGSKTIELIMENYKTNYLFYFFNDNEKKHIFSNNYDEHLAKLNEYRQ